MVLVVDDDPAILGIISLVLHQDYEIVTTPSGKEGVEKSITLKPDLILSDLTLRDLPGQEVIRQIRNESSLAHTPIVVMSGLSDSEGIPGASDFLMKPFSAGELRGKLQQWLRP
jgi:CheY-like chemotaxis protein